jgi:hypothetical protein
MPFVHWLPPGRLRKLLILFFVLLGKEPNWVEVRGSNAYTKAAFYHQYTVKNAFYRHYAIVRQAFEENGFVVTFNTINHPRVRANPLLSGLMELNFFRSILRTLLQTFKLVEMQVEKNGGSLPGAAEREQDLPVR